MRVALFVLMIGFFVFLFSPLIVLVYQSFYLEPGGLHWFRVLFKDESILDAVGLSIEIGIWVAIWSGVWGLFLSMRWSYARHKSEKDWLGFFHNLPLALPDICLGLALLCFFLWIRFPLGKTTIIMAHSVVGAMLVTTLVIRRLGTLDPFLIDAARDLGAGPWRTFFQVILPQLFLPLISGMILAFTFSFDDFIIAFFTSGVGSTTLPLKIYSMLKFGISPAINALSTLILAVSLTLIVMSSLIRRKKV